MSTLKLLFCSNGTAVLEEDDEPTWASDDDEDFPLEVGDPNTLNIEDATRILVYLVERDILTESESQLCSMESEDDDDEDIIDAKFEEIDSATTRPS